MGMDLKGRRPSAAQGDWFHFNWAGWSMVGNLLDQLGCPTHEMSGSNDGDYVKKDTCMIWAQTIREAIAAGRVRVDGVPSSMHAGGYRELFTVDDPSGRALNNEEISCLIRFCEFLETCNGFRQY